MASKDYNNKRAQLGALLKSEPVKTPIQEVRPVTLEPPVKPAAKAEKAEAHLNYWVPADLMRRLKIHAAKTGKSVKQIGIEALEQYLKGE